MWTVVLPPAPGQSHWVLGVRWRYGGGLEAQREWHHRKSGEGRRRMGRKGGEDGKRKSWKIEKTEEAEKEDKKEGKKEERRQNL